MSETGKLKYMILGTGGTGGAVGGYMAKAGYDVTFIARGEHLRSMKVNGLRVIRPKDEFIVDPVKAYSMEEFISLASYDESFRPDVIFVCVKGYSLMETVPFISKVSHAETIVIPILNIYGTGSVLQAELPDLMVTDGCIYVASEIKGPGVILMNGEILRVFFGIRKGDEGRASSYENVLCKIRDDLVDSGINGVYSDDIAKDALLKFSYVSPQNACGIYYNVPAGPIQEHGEIRDCFAGLVHEIDRLAGAMGINFGEDIVQRNLKILDALKPNMTTSLQRDIMAGKPNELDGLVFEVVRMGERHGFELPIYSKIAAELHIRFNC